MDTTYAIVVAVEEYPGLGAKWTLPGVAEEAANFVKWLVNDRHLPTANIHVFTNGIADFGAVAQEDASADVLNKFLANIGITWPDGKLLLIYWAGHGFVSREGTRRLFFGDATTAVKSNLDLEQLIQVLRSTARGGFDKQIAVIDACAKFFESLQTTKGLPAGGLPEGILQMKGVEQYFYFAASSGQFATQSAFGPRVLELLQRTPAEEWPPDARMLRNGIEDLFDQLVADRQAGQQPAWLEYSDGKDNRMQRGVLPTTDAIHDVIERAILPLPFVRSLAEQAARCATLFTREGRDGLVAALPADLPIFRPRHTRDDLNLDLMSLIVGSIEQGLEQQLALAIVRMEENSTPAYLFRKMIGSVSRLRELWPLLAATRLTTARAQILFRQAHTLWVKDREPESVEQAVEMLQGLGSSDALVEFLVCAARVRPEDNACRDLGDWIKLQLDWAPARARAELRLDEEAKRPRYLLLQVEQSRGVSRVKKAWIYMAETGDPLSVDSLPVDSTLAQDIATLLNQVERTGGTVHLEILLPEALFHLDAKQLSSRNRNLERDLERMHPTALRWSERMESAEDSTFETGRWRQAAKEIELRRLRLNARAGWVDQDCDLNGFCQEFEEGRRGELIGIEVASDGEQRGDVLTWICYGGLPYALWPRRGGVNLTAAKTELSKMLLRHSFEDLSLFKNKFALDDMLLLWDDPRRNPFVQKMKDVRIREVNPE